MTAPSMGGTAAGGGGATSPALMQCEAKQTCKKVDDLYTNIAKQAREGHYEFMFYVYNVMQCNAV